MIINRSIKLFLWELQMIFKNSGRQLFIIGLLIGFLVFILNIFLGISLYTHQFSGTLKDKLGIYFYIKDIPWNEPVVYKEIILLKEELESKWLEVSFSSKEDAFGFLQKRLPNILENFEKFGIENPLPATLYVMFDDEKEYNYLKTSIIAHKSIILNIKDIDKWATLKQQENRVLKVVNFTNFIMVSSYVLVLVLWIVILFFLMFLLENIFQRFRKDLSIKKFLWATSNQIAKSFMWITFFVLLESVVVSSILILIWTYIVNYYLFELFSLNLLEVINIWKFIGVLFLEFIFILSISLLVSFGFVTSLNKKIK